jgi:hypothetical protein
MSGKKQVGLRVDENLYRQFKQDVKDRRGRWNGVAGEELEKAMREYLTGPYGENGNDIHDRLARIEEAVGIEAADGGTHTLPDAEHTHTPTERPDPQTATETKVKWLAKCVEHRVNEGFEEVPEQILKDVVADEYGFRRDTAKRYVERLINHFDLVDHPTADLLVTSDRREEILREQASDRTEELDT